MNILKNEMRKGCLYSLMITHWINKQMFHNGGCTLPFTVHCMSLQRHNNINETGVKYFTNYILYVC